MVKKNQKLVMLTNSKHPETETKYIIISNPTRAFKAGKKPSFRKNDPVVRRFNLILGERSGN